MDPVPAFDVFICYRWADPDMTWVREELCPALAAKYTLIERLAGDHWIEIYSAEDENAAPFLIERLGRKES